MLGLAAFQPATAPNLGLDSWEVILPHAAKNRFHPPWARPVNLAELQAFWDGKVPQPDPACQASPHEGKW